MDKDHVRGGKANGHNGRSPRSQSFKQGKSTNAEQVQAATGRSLLKPARAQRIIQFIEYLKIPSGVGVGTTFKLSPFQIDFINDIYAPHDRITERRLVRRAILSMGRKNGKTALIAAMALAHLVGPEAIPNGEIYSAANDRDQAGIVFKFAKQIVEAEPELLDKIEIITSSKTMHAKRTGSIYRAISAEAGTKHGYMPSLVIYDELAQAKSRELYDVMDTSFGARTEPLFDLASAIRDASSSNRLWAAAVRRNIRSSRASIASGVIRGAGGGAADASRPGGCGAAFGTLTATEGGADE